MSLTGQLINAQCSSGEENEGENVVQNMCIDFASAIFWSTKYCVNNAQFRAM